MTPREAMEVIGLLAVTSCGAIAPTSAAPQADDGGRAETDVADAFADHASTELAVEAAAPPKDDVWGTCAPMQWWEGSGTPPVGDANFPVLTPLPDGRVLAGTPEFIYDPKSDSYTTIPKGTAMGDGQWTRPVVMKDGKSVLIAGDGMAYILDTETFERRETTPMHLARSGQDVVLLADGRIMEVGGVFYESEDEPGMPAAEIFDPATAKWTATSPPEFGPKAALGGPHVVMLSDDDLLVTSSDWGCLNFRYSISTDTWRRTSPMPHFVFPDRVAKLSDGRVFALGDSSCTADGAKDPTPRAAIYDPATETWRETAPPQASGWAYSLPKCDHVLVIGPAGAALYDVHADAWHVVPARPPDTMTNVLGPTAAQLADGNILWAWGGMYPGVPLLFGARPRWTSAEPAHR